MRLQGGSKIYEGVQVDALLNATETFASTVTDPKAQIILTIEGITGLVFTPVVLFFYDGEDPGDSFVAFDDILATIDTVLVQSFSSFVGAQAVELLTNPRGTSHTVSVSSLTPTLLDAVKTQIEVTRSCASLRSSERVLTSLQGLAEKQLLHSGSLVTVDVDPFLQYGQYATDSAYPHADSPLPVCSPQQSILVPKSEPADICLEYRSAYTLLGT